MTPAAECASTSTRPMGGWTTKTKVGAGALRTILHNVRTTVMGMACAIALAGPAHALPIEPTSDTSLTSNANATEFENTINPAGTTVDGPFINPGTVQGQSDDGEAFVSHLQYTRNSRRIP